MSRLPNFAADRAPALDPNSLLTLPQSGPAAAIGWLRHGWDDLRALPLLSTALGVVIAALVGAGQAATEGVPPLTMPGILACIAAAPFALALFFSLSRALDSGREARLAIALADVRRNSLALGTLYLILTLVTVAGLRLTAIGIALSMGPSIPAGVLTDPTSGAVVPTVAFFVGSSIVAIAVFVLATFGVPAVYARHDSVFTSIGTGVSTLRKNLSSLPVWAATLLGVGALAIWVTPLVLVPAFPLLAYANWHAFAQSHPYPGLRDHA